MHFYVFAFFFFCDTVVGRIWSDVYLKSSLMDSQSGRTSGNNLRVEELGINRFNVAALSIAWASCQIEQNETDKLHINKPQHVFGIYILIITHKLEFSV